MIPVRKLLLISGCLALLAGSTAIPVASAATTTREALFPAIGTYEPSGGVNLHGETVPADIVTINPSGLPRFEVLVQYTNHTSSIQTDNCLLPNGHVKTPDDTWLTVNKKVILKAIDSTCSQEPGYKNVLAPGQTDTYFVAFPLPPALGATVQLSSLFGNSKGGVSRFYTAPFNPYTRTTGLRVVKFRPSSKAAIQLLLDGKDLYLDGKDLANTIKGVKAFGGESISILDANLILPWIGCGNAACVRKLTPSPYLPEISRG